MKNVIPILVFIVITSCAKDRSILGTLPIVEVGNRFRGENIDYTIRVPITTDDQEKLLKDASISFVELYGISRLKVQEMDSSYLRPFELVLLEHQKEGLTINSLVTVDAKKGSLIDVYDFNRQIWDISTIYSHSSEVSHDGIAIEFIESTPSKDSPKILGRSIEVLETGEIKYISESLNQYETFNKLGTTNVMCGNYKFNGDDIWTWINLTLKDGMSGEFYAFRLTIQTPEGCMDVYESLDVEVTDGIILLDSLNGFRIELAGELPKVICEEYSSGCDELIELNYELKKAENNAQNSHAR